MDNQAAKEMFVLFEGLKGHMKREGVYEKYLQFGISTAQESKWLEELIEQRISELKNSSNFRSILFLTAHGQFQYLETVLNHEPKGTFDEKCAYLEGLVKMIRGRSLSSDLRERISTYVNERANQLKPRTTEGTRRKEAILQLIKTIS